MPRVEFGFIQSSEGPSRPIILFYFYQFLKLSHGVGLIVKELGPRVSWTGLICLQVKLHF